MALQPQTLWRSPTTGGGTAKDPRAYRVNKPWAQRASLAVQKENNLYFKRVFAAESMCV